MCLFDTSHLLVSNKGKIMEKYIYQFSDDHLVYMKEQIWEAKFDLEVYHNLSVHEFLQIEQHIGTPKKVLEVGCGLGRGSIFLNHLLKDNTVEYTLADRTGYTTNTGAFNPTQDEFYNDLALTDSFCRLNGIKNVTTFDTELDDWKTLPKFDLIFSLCSFGMHVQIERYMERLHSILTPGGTMIFGTRGGGYGPQSFNSQFEKVIFQHGIVTQPFPLENWLILQNPK